MLVGVPLLDEVVDDYEDAATRLPGYPATRLGCSKR